MLSGGSGDEFDPSGYSGLPNKFLFPKARLLYRFMSRDEYARLKETSNKFHGNPLAINAQGKALSDALNRLIINPNFGEMLYNHTMTASGGGSIGHKGELIATTEDVDKLAQSTCHRVQAIVTNADYIVTFEVPQDAAIGAPSDLSKTEGEVLVPNDFQALAAMMIDCSKNYYKK